MSILSLVRLGNGFAYVHLSYGQASTYCPDYVTVLVFVCPYVRTTLANSIAESYIYILMSNVQLPRSKTFYSQIIMHSCTQNNDVSLAKQFQTNISTEYRKHIVIDQGKYRKIVSKKNGQTESIMFRIMLMLHTKF